MYSFSQLQTDQNHWRTIFLISTGFYISTTIFYFIFAKGDLEKWDPVSEKQKENVP